MLKGSTTSTTHFVWCWKTQPPFLDAETIYLNANLRGTGTQSQGRAVKESSARIREENWWLIFMYVYSVCQIHDSSRNPHRNPMPCIFMYPLNRHLHGPTVYMRIFGKKPIRMAPSTHGTSRREPQEVCISFRRIRHFGRSSIFILFLGALGSGPLQKLQRSELFWHVFSWIF